MDNKRKRILDEKRKWMIIREEEATGQYNWAAKTGVCHIWTQYICSTNTNTKIQKIQKHREYKIGKIQKYGEYKYRWKCKYKWISDHQGGGGKDVPRLVDTGILNTPVHNSTIGFNLCCNVVQTGTKFRWIRFKYFAKMKCNLQATAFPEDHPSSTFQNSWWNVRLCVFREAQQTSRVCFTGSAGPVAAGGAGGVGGAVQGSTLSLSAATQIHFFQV